METYILNKDLPIAFKEWILWKDHSAESIEEQLAKLERSIEEFEGCAQLSQSTSSKEDARAAKEPRCDSTQCLEVARRQPAAHIEIEKITRADLPREKRSTVRGKPYRQSVGKCIRTRENPPPDPPARKQGLRDLPLIALPRKNVRIGRGSVRIGRGPCPPKRKLCARD